MDRTTAITSTDLALFDALAALARALAESIEYSHRPLPEQLETFGIRWFELDVHADQEGNLYSLPPMIMLSPEAAIAPKPRRRRDRS